MKIREGVKHRHVSYNIWYETYFCIYNSKTKIEHPSYVQEKVVQDDDFNKMFQEH